MSVGSCFHSGPRLVHDVSVHSKSMDSNCFRFYAVLIEGLTNTLVNTCGHAVRHFC